MDSPQLIQELVKSFNALADQVQNLTDRKTILEHKLRYAHEQVCTLPPPPTLTALSHDFTRSPPPPQKLFYMMNILALDLHRTAFWCVPGDIFYHCLIL